jgi:ATP-binding cassette subfamily B (MDR/TAP) protein 1
MDSLSKAGGISQETLSTIRTVHAFGAEKKLQAVFDHFIDQTRTFDIKFSGVLGAGMAFFSFIVYCSYSLSFYFGTTLLLQGHGMYPKLLFHWTPLSPSW